MLIMWDTRWTERSAPIWVYVMPKSLVIRGRDTARDAVEPMGNAVGPSPTASVCGLAAARRAKGRMECSLPTVFQPSDPECWLDLAATL